MTKLWGLVLAEPSDGSLQLLLTDGFLWNTAQVSLTVNLLPTRLVWSDKLPWLLSGNSLKSYWWNATLAERSQPKQNKPGFAFSLVDGIPLRSNVNPDSVTALSLNCLRGGGGRGRGERGSQKIALRSSQWRTRRILVQGTVDEIKELLFECTEQLLKILCKMICFVLWLPLYETI